MTRLPLILPPSAATKARAPRVGLVRDQRGIALVEKLIVIAALGLGCMVAVRSVASSRSELGQRVAAAILSLSPQGAGSEVLPAVASPDMLLVSASSPQTAALATSEMHLPGRGGEDDAPPQVSFPGKAQGTDGTYTAGPPTHPPVHYDNGHLQNPNDAKDPNPQPTREPTEEEKKAYDSAVFNARAGKAAIALHVPSFLVPEDKRKFLDTPDGVEAYLDFLTGDGSDWHFSYDKFVQEDAAGREILDHAIGDTQTAAEQLYQQLLASDPSLAGKPVSFQVSGSAIPVGSNDPKYADYRYPDTDNWQKAIGAHNIWNSATVTVTPPKEPGGKPTFSMQYKLNAEDRYNFNPGATDIETGQPDSDNGRFEQGGLAHQFMSYSQLEREVTWTQADIPGSTQVGPSSR